VATLDDQELYTTFDPSNMLARIEDLPRHCRQAWQDAVAFSLPADYSTCDKVVVAGMGGSAIGADLLSSLASQEGRTPVWVHRDYELPPWVDDRTLVVACSHSGNTEETLSSFCAALRTPAKKLAVTTGGKLKSLADDNDVPVLHFECPTEPRTAFGHNFFSLLGLAHRLGIVSVEPRDLDETLGLLEDLTARLGKDVPQERNPAKQLAGRLWGRLIVVYGAGILAKVALRWKAQVNENSKSHAFAEALPELNHNAVVGYKLPTWAGEKTSVVMLRSPSSRPRMLKRYEVTAELLADAGIACDVVDVEGKIPLAQAMSSVRLGDFVSYYLALLNGVDPSPVAAIDYLKRRLAETDTGC